jgi:DNA helicase-2/ATP-dependent DNA helicase PcrA
MTVPAPGHPSLGRGVVVTAGAEPPLPWSACPRHRIDDDVMADPLPLVEQLHDAWLHRRPVVVELAVDPAELRAPEVITLEPHRCDPGMELARERLQFLAWTNSYDARSTAGEPIWWHGRRAARLGAREGGPADVVLAGGAPVWCDGGPCEALGLDSEVLHRWSIEAGSLVGAPNRAVPNRAVPNRAAPNRASPKGAVPNRAVPNRAAPNRAVPNRAAPNRAAPNRDADLAPDQLAAVTHPRGPARVIAPAGSGKTRVLTARLRHLLAERGVHPSSVTAVAFNRKAVDELAERTADLAASGLEPHIRTVNSLALAICNGLGEGQARKRLLVVTEREVRRILESVTHVRPQANTDILAPYLEAMSMVRIGLVDPAKAEEAFPDAQGLPGVFAQYRRVLAREGLVDFDEQIYMAIQILLSDPDARHGVQALARHLLVDEFQDLAPAHLLLLRLVGAPVLDCFGVGDDDQCIYGYAGADPEYLIGFERYFPGATAYGLHVGYRCPPAVIEAAANLCSHNRRRIPKSTGAAPDRLPRSDDLTIRTVDPTQMGPAACEQVESWAGSGVGLADMAVLARVNAALLGAQVALTAKGIACTRPLDAQVLERTGMRSALAYLRIAVDPARIERADIAETIRRPPRRIARNVVEMLTKPARTGVNDIGRLAKRLSGEDSKKLSSYADDLRALAAAAPSGTAAVLRSIRLRVGLGEAMSARDGAPGAGRRA